MADVTEKPAAPVEAELAAMGGDDIGAQFVGELLAAEDDILKARGGNLTVYESVFRDGQVKSCFEQLRAAIVSREWRVEPGGDAPLDVRAADDLRAQLNGVAWDQATRKMLTGAWYGYSVAECMLRAESARVVLTDLRVRKARRFRFDKERRLRLLKAGNPTGLQMPERKFWVFRAAADDDDTPYPLGLAYWCYWPVWFKRNAIRFWGLWTEKFAQPTAWGQLPPGATEDDRAKMLRLLGSITSEGKIVTSTSAMVKLLEALERAGDDYEVFCKYLDGEIAKVILSQTMTTDDGSSRSQAEVHAEVKLDVIKSWADMLCESFVQGPATWLTTWNYPGAKVPRVWRDCQAPAADKARAERDVHIKTLGYSPTQAYIDETYGVGFTPTPAAPPLNTPSFAEPGEGATIGPAAAVVSSALDGDGWRRLVGPELDAVEALLADASSLEDFRDRLGELAERDPAAVTDGLARALFAARVAGELGAEIDGDDD